MELWFGVHGQSLWFQKSLDVSGVDFINTAFPSPSPFLFQPAFPPRPTSLGNDLIRHEEAAEEVSQG